MPQKSELSPKPPAAVTPSLLTITKLFMPPGEVSTISRSPENVCVKLIFVETAFTGPLIPDTAKLITRGAPYIGGVPDKPSAIAPVPVPANVRATAGVHDGEAVLVGVAVGVLDGVPVGVLVGVAVGVRVGVFVAVLVGAAVGVFVGVFVGVRVGVLVDVDVAVAVGIGVPQPPNPFSLNGKSCTDMAVPLSTNGAQAVVNCNPLEPGLLTCPGKLT